MPDVFVGMVVGPGLRTTAVVECASARLYPPGAHLELPAGLRLRGMGPEAIGGRVRCHRNPYAPLGTLRGAESDTSCRCRSSASSCSARPWPRPASCA